jgi:hypothetical protein
LQSCYKDRLEENITEQFKAADDALTMWSKICTELGKYVESIKDNFKQKSISGVQFYQGMVLTKPK